MMWFAALLAGIVIAWLYCAGLWLTVALAPRRAHPLVWFGLGCLLRLVFVGAAFFTFVRLGPQMALAALTGFAAVRGGIIYWMRAPGHLSNPLTQ